MKSHIKLETSSSSDMTVDSGGCGREGQGNAGKVEERLIPQQSLRQYLGVSDMRDRSRDVGVDFVSV